jgi:hypothetical protein
MLMWKSTINPYQITWRDRMCAASNAHISLATQAENYFMTGKMITINVMVITTD